LHNEWDNATEIRKKGKKLTSSKLSDNLNGALVHLKDDWAFAEGISLCCALQAASR